MAIAAQFKTKNNLKSLVSFVDIKWQCLRGTSERGGHESGAETSETTKNQEHLELLYLLKTQQNTKKKHPSQALQRVSHFMAASPKAVDGSRSLRKRQKGIPIAKTHGPPTAPSPSEWKMTGFQVISPGFSRILMCFGPWRNFDL